MEKGRCEKELKCTMKVPRSHKRICVEETGEAPTSRSECTFVYSAPLGTW